MKGVHGRNLYFLRYKKSNYKKVDLLILFTLCECDTIETDNSKLLNSQRIMLETPGIHIAVKSAVILAEFRT